MLPSELVAKATSYDIGLLQDYYAARAEAQRKARADADLMASADTNADKARRSL